MKKALILFVFCSLIWTCKQKPNPVIWTKEYEQGFYNYLDSTSKSMTPDSIKRAKYVAFLIKRYKEEIPNGINSVSKDSLHNLNNRLGREYAIKERNEGNITELISHYERWTPILEKDFKDNYVAIFQSMGPGFGEKLCDCMIGRLKKIYPDSILLPIPKDINRKLNLECAEVIKKRKSI
ncbi:hypothetical protein ACFFGT_30955 [Mucilaginibacter angelicae]|uniref:Uncharacterized protein n=1 Tax=Mucilaginibacter angelicae TaxID=869718 RepID=A0ABV6LGT4_9SPHI